MRKLLFALLLAAPLAALAAPMTNEDVIKMVRGGLSEAIVIQAIDASEPAFDTSTDGLIGLKGGGVSDAIIQRIFARKSAAPVAGQASGVGAVAGGVLGGVLGRQIAGDRNRTAGTVVGAVGGAVAGHQIEKHAKSGKHWELSVRFEDGSVRTFSQETQPSVRQGDRVRLVDGTIVPRGGS